MSRLGSKMTAFRVGITLLIILVLTLAIQDFYQVAAGTQNWIGKFTLTWGATLVGLVGIGLLLSIFGLLSLWQVRWTAALSVRLTGWRARLGWVRWLLVMGFALIPVKIFLYTPLGTKLTGVGFRLAIFIITAIIMTFWATRGKSFLVSWRGGLISLVILGSVFALGKAFNNVVDYPLSLTWSEGNRIWDYSILFGRDLYNYPKDQPIEAYIDKARQTLWGLPFLLPHVSILVVRLWSAILFTIPYAILGWMTFRPLAQKRSQWFWLGVWSFLFLYQGPIYTPLILAAILVAGARRKPLWLALPLVFLAGNYAQGSRITWMVGPAIWAGMVALSEPGVLKDGKVTRRDWLRIVAFGLAGFLGGFGIMRGWLRIYNYITRAIQANAGAVSTPPPEVVYINPGDSVEAVSSIGPNSWFSNQPVLWERLLPNPTYGLGILLGLLLAVGPLVVLLIYLARSKRWKLNFWQQLGVFGGLVALMVLGVLISTKIGGGGDLHNLDMFLVSLLFVAAIAWETGGYELFSNLDLQSLGIKLLLVVVVAVPSFTPWINAEPLELPPEDKTQWTLDLLQYETDRVLSEGGEILFMDQRQLLTFGYFGDIPLVPEYEKKLVMDKAMTGDVEYFEQFYRDLSTHRFSLIVTDPQRIRYSDDEEDWGAENDAWVSWVTEPLLCYYEPAYTIKKTGVWLLVPVDEPGECSYP